MLDAAGAPGRRCETGFRRRVEVRFDVGSGGSGEESSAEHSRSRSRRSQAPRLSLHDEDQRPDVSGLLLVIVVVALWRSGPRVARDGTRKQRGGVRHRLEYLFSGDGPL